MATTDTRQLELIQQGNRGAHFSPDRAYRYLLWEHWTLKFRPVAFLMLNPSKADEVDNDPTVARCIERAKRWGYGGVIILNLFALVSTDPRGLRTVADPVGPENDYWIDVGCRKAGRVIAAWGTHGAYLGRDRAVRFLLAQRNIQPHALRLTKENHPEHPLYVPYDVEPVALS